MTYLVQWYSVELKNSNLKATKLIYSLHYITIGTASYLPISPIVNYLRKNKNKVP